MAETGNKRNSSAAAGKVATPKPQQQPAPPAAPLPVQDSLDGLYTALGARIKITTVSPQHQSFEGVLFTADPITNLVAINTTPAPPNPSTSLSSQPGNYHIIPIKHILSFQILSLADQGAAPDAATGDSVTSSVWKAGNNATPKIGPVDIKKLKEREEKAVQKQKDDLRKRGKGVSAEAQAIFDALDRLYSNATRWHEQSIIVMDSVMIDPPYGPDDCKAPKDKAHMLPHIKRIVDGERRKIASRAQGGATTPPVNQRKGG